MSDAAAAIIVAVLLAGSLPAAYWQIRRAMRHESQRDRIVREAHARAELARDWDAVALAWDLPAYTGPEPAAALEQLRQAINEDQTKGEL